MFQSAIIFAPLSHRQTRLCSISSKPSDHKQHKMRICLEISAKEAINKTRKKEAEFTEEVKWNGRHFIWEQAKAIIIMCIAK